mmetsp:Transcript_43240/g.78686  ORF Transcript_43240/g.78686 Transcript_43240/m.78686 type:complete len:148 (-) Transcript_43240:59-502(-)
MLYSFYIFGRGRKCLCREEWNRVRPCADVKAEAKLISGLVLTLKSWTQQMGSARTKGFVSYTTTQYKFHYFETLTGYRFVLTTDPTVADQQDLLRSIYTDLFVEHVVRNPMYHLGEDVSKCTIFVVKLRNCLQTRPYFASLPPGTVT